MVPGVELHKLTQPLISKNEPDTVAPQTLYPAEAKTVPLHFLPPTMPATEKVGAQAALAIEQLAFVPPLLPLHVQVWLPPQLPAEYPLGEPVVQVLADPPQTPVTGHAALAIEHAAFDPPPLPLHVQVWLPPQLPAEYPLGEPAVQVFAVPLHAPLTALAPQLQYPCGVPILLVDVHGPHAIQLKPMKNEQFVMPVCVRHQSRHAVSIPQLT